VACSTISADQPHEFVEFLRGACFTLAKEVVRFQSIAHDGEPSPEISTILWPSLFVFSNEEAKVSASLGQHRGCFLIGIDCPSLSLDQVSMLQRKLSVNFEPSVRQHRVFVDEPKAPKISAKVVSREDLGPLVLDNHMWPQPLKELRALVVSSGEGFDASDAYFALSDEMTSATSNAEKTPSDSKTKLRPAGDVLKRLQWDSALDLSDFVVVYLDRFTGYQELPASSWTSETSDDEFIPLHRITAFRKLTTGDTVWHRDARIDRIFK
jgi:uncharacterized protein (UPF0248 family)